MTLSRSHRTVATLLGLYWSFLSRRDVLRFQRATRCCSTLLNSASPERILIAVSPHVTPSTVAVRSDSSTRSTTGCPETMRDVSSAIRTSFAIMFHQRVSQPNCNSVRITLLSTTSLEIRFTHSSLRRLPVPDSGFAPGSRGVRHRSLLVGATNFPTFTYPKRIRFELETAFTSFHPALKSLRGCKERTQCRVL